MIVLDTNVLSELMTESPSVIVQDWLRRHGQDRLCTTTVCEAEIFVGIAVLPDGRRKGELARSAASVFSRGFTGPILPFDSAAARLFADIVAARQERGAPIQLPDAMIAATARAHGAAVATRNVADFESCGIIVHNPWAAG